MAATRALCLALVLSGCSVHLHHEEPSDASTSSPPMCTPPASCTCGNGVVETCYIPGMPGHACDWVPGNSEECEGTTTKTCAELGYYGGTTACTACKVDATACDACPPSSRCTSTTALDVGRDVEASGTRVAVSGADAIAIFDGTSEVARVAISQIQDLTAAPGGWFIVANDPPKLYFLDTTGQLGAPTSLWNDAGVARIAYANNRLVYVTAGPDAQTGDTHLYATITDLTGAITVPDEDLGPASLNGLFEVTSDGTAFFAACGNQLFRITTTGAFSAVGDPVGGNTDFIAWGGTSGWFGTYFGAQRFDSTGAFVGSPITLPLGGDGPIGQQRFAADGDDLIALRAPSSANTAGLDVLRIAPDGTTTSTAHAGAGSPYRAGIARVGTDVFVGWSLSGHLQVALVTP